MGTPRPAHPSGSLLAPDLAAFEALADAAFAALPEAVRTRCAGLVIRIADFADDEMLDDLEIDDPLELTGLYQGVALTERSVLDDPGPPDMVWLFRRAIIDEWADRGDVTLGDLVAHVLVHEVGHHMGLSDDDILAIDDWRL